VRESQWLKADFKSFLSGFGITNSEELVWALEQLVKIGLA